MLGNGWMFLEIHPILSSTSGHRAPHPQVSARLRFQIILQGLQRCLQVVVVPGHRDGALGVHGSKRKQNGLSENWVPQSFDGLSSQFSLLFGGILRQKVEGLVRIFQKTLASGTAKKLPIEKPQC